MNRYHDTYLRFLCAFGIGALLAASISTSHAATGAGDSARGYALVVGSNPGGPGQEILRYAEDDAERVARVLIELGGVDARRVRLLKRPSPRALLSALDDIATALRTDAEQGVATRFFFYYSGHARAHALNLGRTELRLSLLRDKLTSLPARLTIIVLDACQSGAFSRVKGVQAAADFSYNSVSRLNASGVAVMASSSASELSQESNALRSSYFTHHLLVALRGAGDSNRDGRVSLDEAYEYAYQQTLASTAATAVGSQHVTLETELRGQGDVPLSFPAKADAHLVLPAELSADVLVQTQPGGAAVAEVHKSAGEGLLIALPSGEYRAIVRARGVARQCRMRLVERRAATLRWNRCAPLAVAASASKGGAAAGVRGVATVRSGPLLAKPIGRRFGFEFNASLGRVGDDAFTRRLGDFGFGSSDDVYGHLQWTGSYRWRRNVDILATLERLEYGQFRRGNEEGAHLFSWSTWSGSLALRVLSGGPGSRFRWYAQAGAGLARASTLYEVSADNSSERESFLGYRLGAGAGLHLALAPSFALTAGLDYTYAPVLKNLLGDVHDSGSLDFALGWRLLF